MNAGLVPDVWMGLTVGIAVGFYTDVHAAPLDHNAFVMGGLYSATKRQKGNASSAAMFVLAIDPLAF